MFRELMVRGLKMDGTRNTGGCVGGRGKMDWARDKREGVQDVLDQVGRGRIEITWMRSLD